MGLFDKVSGFVKREAEDIGEAAERARDRLDKELTEREEELEMTPSEKLRHLQRQARQTDDRIDQIMEKAGASTAAAEAEAEVQAAAPVDMAPPSVTQIVLPDGSVRSGNDPGLGGRGATTEDEDEVPDEGDLSWVAPREGEEAVVPAFSASVGTAAPSGANEDTTGAEQAEAEDDRVEAAPALEAAPSSAPAPSEAAPEPTAAEPVAAEPVAAEAAPAPSEAPAAATPEPAVVDLGIESAPAAAEDTLPPPPPPPLPEPAPVAEPAPAPAAVAEEAPRRETPAEIAARVVAELERAVADDPVAAAPEPVAPAPAPEPTFDKTPAQRKYEEARKAADALLEELRGELRDDGEI